MENDHLKNKKINRNKATKFRRHKNKMAVTVHNSTIQRHAQSANHSQYVLDLKTKINLKKVDRGENVKEIRPGYKIAGVNLGCGE